ncbi:MAG: hypothetical protein ACR2NV_04140 [Thermoleophilaceae bacterium]
MIFDQVGERVAAGRSDFFREDDAARPALEVAIAPGNAHEKAGRHAGREKATNFGEVEELVPDVPDLELCCEARLIVWSREHDEINLSRRAVPVRDRERVAQLDTNRR